MEDYIFGYFKTKGTFEATEVSDNSISFIEETKEIITHGNSFGSVGGVTREEMEQYLDELITQALTTPV